MYKFHYEKMLPRYPNRISLCFTDTDSLLYEVETPNIYEDMMETNDDYDFSEYPFNHPNYDPTNKKVIGKFKDELNSLTMEEFVGVLPKCYSILYRGKVKENEVVNLDPAEKQAAKGTKTAVKDRFLRHEHFTNTLANLSSLIVKQNVIKSRAHVIGSYHQTRTALTAFEHFRILTGMIISTVIWNMNSISIVISK